MARFLAQIFSLLVVSSVCAADVHDAPMPESINWVGIIVFLVILVGGTVGFFWRLWHNDRKSKQDHDQLNA